MWVIFLLAGSALLISDRVLERNAVMRLKERLTYFVYYYRPYMQRRQFFGLILLVMGLSALLDYLIAARLDVAGHLLILPALVLGAYLLVFLLAVFDRFALGKGSVALNFFLLEQELRQHLSLALLIPLFCLAYGLKIFSLLFLYPSEGLFPVRSLAGLAGAVCVGVGLAGYFLL